MAIQEFEPQAMPEPPQIAIWQVYDDGEIMHHLILDGRDTGVIDWEESSDGRTGYIDGLDAEHELDEKGIRNLAWLPIVECMRNIHPDVRSVEHIDGVINFIVSEDFGTQQSL